MTIHNARTWLFENRLARFCIHHLQRRRAIQNTKVAIPSGRFVQQNHDRQITGLIAEHHMTGKISFPDFLFRPAGKTVRRTFSKHMMKLCGGIRRDSWPVRGNLRRQDKPVCLNHEADIQRQCCQVRLMIDDDFSVAQVNDLNPAIGMKQRDESGFRRRNARLQGHFKPPLFGVVIRGIHLRQNELIARLIELIQKPPMSNSLRGHCQLATRRLTCIHPGDRIKHAKLIFGHGLHNEKFVIARSDFVHQQIIALRDQGTAVLLVSVELDEIMALSDRIAVMFDGQIMGERLPAETDERELGLLMAGVSGKAA